TRRKSLPGRRCKLYLRVHGRASAEFVLVGRRRTQGRAPLRQATEEVDRITAGQLMGFMSVDCDPSGEWFLIPADAASSPRQQVGPGPTTEPDLAVLKTRAKPRQRKFATL